MGLRGVSCSRNKKVVVLLNISEVWWKQLRGRINPMRFFLFGFQDRSVGVLADVLTGTVNPSGKLPMTFPEYSDIPSSKNYPIVGENSKQEKF